MASNDSNYGEYELTPRRMFMLSLDIIFFIVGFFGNGSVIYLTLRHKGLRSIPNLMIANLAVGDMLVVLLVIFTNVLYYLMHSMRIIMANYCEFFLFVQFLSQGVSILTLTALSIDRFTVVRFPLRKQRIAKKATIATVAIIWAASFIIVCPIFGLVDDSICFFGDGISNTIYILFLVLLLFIIPALVMLVCYFLTAKELLYRNTDLKLDPQGGKKQQRKRSRLAIIVLLMTIVFIVSSSLTFIWVMAVRISPTGAYVTNVHINRAKAVLLKFNSIVNPIILYLMSSTYKRHLKSCFVVCKSSRGKGVNQSVLQTNISRQSTHGQRESKSIEVDNKMSSIQEESNL